MKYLDFIKEVKQEEKKLFGLLEKNNYNNSNGSDNGCHFFNFLFVG